MKWVTDRELQHARDEVFRPLMKSAQTGREIKLIEGVIAGRSLSSLAKELGISRQRISQVWMAVFPKTMAECSEEIQKKCEPAIERRKSAQKKILTLEQQERNTRTCVRCSRKNGENGVRVLKSFLAAKGKPVCVSCRPAFEGYRHQKAHHTARRNLVQDIGRSRELWSDEELTELTGCATTFSRVMFAKKWQRSVASVDYRYYYLRRKSAVTLEEVKNAVQ